MANPIRAVLFDWGDTLIRFPGSSTDYEGHAACVKAFYESLIDVQDCACFARPDISWSVFQRAYDSVTVEQFRTSRDSQREHSMRDRIDQTLRGAGCLCPRDGRAVDAITQRFADLLVESSEAMPGAGRVLSVLGQRFPLGVVSNNCMSYIVVETLRTARLIDHFATVVISADVGWIKPHPRLFEQAADAIGVDLREVLYVGNDFGSDVRGAKGVGCRTAWLAPAEAPEEQLRATDFRLKTLLDLLAIPALV